MEPMRNEVDRWLTSGEEERLMAASSPIVLALNTGMRQGEILNLQWQDVDFSRGTFQGVLGHKTNHMTQRYAHHSPESLREGVRI